MTESRPPLPPFDLDGALAKVQAAEDAWNSRDPRKVALAYTEDFARRNRDVFLTGRDQVVAFLTAKWERELSYVLRKSLWARAAAPSAHSPTCTACIRITRRQRSG